MVSAEVENICVRICEQLESPDRHKRIDALKELIINCENPEVSSAEVLATFDNCYLHILKCYSDRYESVRNQSSLTVNFFIGRLPPNDFHLTNIISTICERLGKQETVEESEEVRLLSISQVSTLMQSYVESGNGSSLVECYPEIVKILRKSILDSYPAVQRKSCECVVQLCAAADTYQFQQHAEILTKPLYSMLNHKHSQSRIASVQALSHLALHVNPSSEALAQLFMEVSPLLMDSMPLVRQQCGLMGIHMLLELRDRYSYFDRLIPLVLCCLKDDSPEIREHILPLWVKCGKQYYEENENELSKQEQVDLQVENYPSGVHRPTIGCRALVQRSLRLLKLITREASDWKENVRLHSLKLLYQFVLHAEAVMTAKFFEIFPDVAHACCDKELVVANEAIKVADIMGRLFSYDDWREHGFEGLSRNVNRGYLKCFYYMFTSSIGVKYEDLLRVSQFLIEPSFSQSLKPEFQLHVIKLVQTLLDKYEGLKFKFGDADMSSDINLSNLYMNLYIATIKVMALALDQDETHSLDIQKRGNHILETITKYENTEVSNLHENYFEKALNFVDNLDAPLDCFSEPILLFHGLLTICKFRSSYLKVVRSKLNQVWQFCADDAKIKMFSTVSVVMLHWQESIGLELSESTQLLQEFVDSVVNQHIIWKVGANAEAMRSIATATLCAITQGAKLEAPNVLPSLARIFPNLIEDHSIATRNYALKCLYNFGEVNVEDLKAIAYATLQRLDDPSSNIRELAVSVIPKLKPKFEDDEEKATHGREIWQRFICQALEILFLHFEGTEIRLKAAIKGSLLQIAAQHEEDFKDYFQRANAMAFDKSSLIELKKELPFEF